MPRGPTKSIADKTTGALAACKYPILIDAYRGWLNKGEIELYQLL